MQISSRFTIALHIFAAIDVFGKDYKITSDFLAGSIQVNSVIIRNILSQLRNAGLIKVSRGTGGAELAKAPEEITFYDIYAAVESVEDGKLFRFHKNPNPDCPVGRNIHLLLDDMLDDIQDAMEKEMKRYGGRESGRYGGRESDRYGDNGESGRYGDGGVRKWEQQRSICKCYETSETPPWPL